MPTLWALLERPERLASAWSTLRLAHVSRTKGVRWFRWKFIFISLQKTKKRTSIFSFGVVCLAKLENKISRSFKSEKLHPFSGILERVDRYGTGGAHRKAKRLLLIRFFDCDHWMRKGGGGRIERVRVRWPANGLIAKIFHSLEFKDWENTRSTIENSLIGTEI